jgi:hypothetical protein
VFGHYPASSSVMVTQGTSKHVCYTQNIVSARQWNRMTQGTLKHHVRYKILLSARHWNRIMNYIKLHKIELFFLNFEQGWMKTLTVYFFFQTISL